VTLQLTIRPFPATIPFFSHTGLFPPEQCQMTLPQKIVPFFIAYAPHLDGYDFSPSTSPLFFFDLESFVTVCLMNHSQSPPSARTDSFVYFLNDPGPQYLIWALSFGFSLTSIVAADRIALLPFLPSFEGPCDFQVSPIQLFFLANR